MQINLKDLLDNDLKTLIDEISYDIRLKDEIKNIQSKINYDLIIY